MKFIKEMSKFENGVIVEELYLKQPSRYNDPREDLVCRLQKALYVLKQWYVKLQKGKGTCWKSLMQGT
jgi:hypothetical protein